MSDAMYDCYGDRDDEPVYIPEKGEEEIEGGDADERLYRKGALH